MIKSDFSSLEQNFASYIRDPKNQPLPKGMEERRMKIYRDLFFKNIERLLGGIFPVFKKTATETVWLELIREFMVQHEARTPYFPKMGDELIAFLTGRDNNDSLPPFALELAHYENTKTALGFAPDPIVTTSSSTSFDVLKSKLLVSPLARLFAYQYPVHRIHLKFQPKTPHEVPIFLVLSRTVDDRVVTYEINTLTAKLMDNLAKNPSTGRQLLEALKQELPDSPANFIDSGTALLENLKTNHIILSSD